jgi:hypothetical protein
MIEILDEFPDNILAFVCRGQVSKRNYETVLTPAVSKALRGQKKVHLYYETAADIDGIDPSAV